MIQTHTRGVFFVSILPIQINIINWGQIFQSRFQQRYLFPFLWNNIDDVLNFGIHIIYWVGKIDPFLERQISDCPCVWYWFWVQNQCFWLHPSTVCSLNWVQSTYCLNCKHWQCLNCYILDSKRPRNLFRKYCFRTNKYKSMLYFFKCLGKYLCPFVANIDILDKSRLINVSFVESALASISSPLSQILYELSLRNSNFVSSLQIFFTKTVIFLLVLKFYLMGVGLKTYILLTTYSIQ